MWNSETKFNAIPFRNLKLQIVLPMSLHHHLPSTLRA